MISRSRLFILFALLLVGAAELLLYSAPQKRDDLYPRWVGTRVLLAGGDPYGPEVSREAERRRYGHVLSPLEIAGHRDQERFAYPLYVTFFLLPVAGLDFATARHVLWLMLSLCVVLSIPAWAEAMGWRSRTSVLVSLAALVLFSPISQRGLRFTQLALLVAFLLAASAWSLVRGHRFVAGSLLAAATIKPQMAMLAVVWLLIWSTAEWRERWKLTAGFTLSLSLLVGTSLLLLPSWPHEFLSGLMAYRGYTGAPSAVGAILGKPLSSWLTACLVLVLIVAMLGVRKADPNDIRFACMTASTLAATCWLMPAMWDPFNQLLMLPAFCLLGRYFQTKRAEVALPRIGLRSVVSDSANHPS